jgi:hypothetical protein
LSYGGEHLGRRRDCSPRYPSTVSLTKEQRNGIFELIQEVGLGAEDFGPPQDEGQSTRIEHKPTGSRYVVNEPDGEGDRRFVRNVGRGPGTQGWVEDSHLLAAIREWLTEVERDFRTPDLWEEFSQARRDLSGSVPAPADNTPFTVDEQAEIESRLRDVASYAAETGKFDDDDLRFLNAKIDFLIESSRHSRRFDWREQVVGAFLSAVVGNVLPQGATMDVLNTIVSTVGHLIGHPVLGLPR